MCDSYSVQFVRIYNQAPLKQMCASVLKQHYISNVHRTLDKYFAKEFTASEMSYLTGRSKDKLLPVMLHTLSMSSSTFLPFSSDVMGKYDIMYVGRVGGSMGPIQQRHQTGGGVGLGGRKPPSLPLNLRRRGC